MRLVSWNLHGSRSPDLHLAAESLLELDPDVIAIQEVRRRQAKRLSRLLGALDWQWALKHRPLGRFVPVRAEGLAVLSRAAITGSAWVELSTDVSVGSHRRRIAMYADTTVDGPGVRVVNVHLASGRKDDERQAQADRLVASRWLADGPPALIVGDLNTPGELPAFLAAALLESESAVQATFPSHDPRDRIDRALVGAESGARIVAVDVPEGGPWSRLSDHRPLVVDLELQPT